MNITLVLHNIRSTYNVGAILRTAEGLGVERVVYSGYTPRYHNATLLPHLREKLDRQIAKAALGAEEMVPQEALDDLTKWLECATMEGWAIVGLENNLSEAEQGRKIVLGERQGEVDARIDARDEESSAERGGLGEKIVLILGEEVAGIPAEIRAKCQYFLEIPMQGRKESFNVSVATAIAVWGLQHG